MYAAFSSKVQEERADSSFVRHSEDVNCIKKDKDFMTKEVKPRVGKHIIGTDQLFTALLWQPHGVILVKVADGLVKRSKGLEGCELLIVLQQGQTEGEGVSLTVQHIRQHCRQIITYHP